MNAEAKLEAAMPSPGARLKAARLSKDISDTEVAQSLNWMPAYVGMIERDDYQSLRQPAFARGYVQAYARLLDLDQSLLLREFDELRGGVAAEGRRRVSGQPLQLQHTGVGVVIGLTVLFMLVVALWWWQGGGPERGL